MLHSCGNWRFSSLKLDSARYFEESFTARVLLQLHTDIISPPFHVTSGQATDSCRWCHIMKTWSSSWGPWKPLDHAPLRNPLVPDVRITAGRSRGLLEPYLYIEILQKLHSREIRLHDTWHIRPLGYPMMFFTEVLNEAVWHYTTCERFGWFSILQNHQIVVIFQCWGFIEDIWLMWHHVASAADSMLRVMINHMALDGRSLILRLAAERCTDGS